MNAELDHVFVLCSEGAPEAAELLSLGIQEGSGNVHPGQGTACRRFFFTNAYLELLWVSDPQEVRSERTRPTRLWERWSGRGRSACPFGIVLRPTKPGEPAPFAAWEYHPAYLPPELCIHVARDTHLSEPEVFYLAFQRGADQRQPQPVSHVIPAQRLTALEIGMPGLRPRSSVLQEIHAAGIIDIRPSREYRMELTFDGAAHGASADLRPALPVSFRW